MLCNVNFGSLIDGKWVDKNKTIGVFNPSNNQLLGNISDVGSEGAENAVEAAFKAFGTWSKETSENRAKLLMKWFEIIINNKNELSEIVTLESGKPLKESLVEVEYGASFIKWFAEQAKRIEGSLLSSPDTKKRMLILKQPVGVVSAITPWNFPVAMIARKASAAIAAGCTIVLKPSELTPLSANKLGEFSIKAGIPNGVFNIVNGMPEPIGEILSTHRLVSKITFTGSTNVGKLLMRNASKTIKGVSLELGGNAPFLIFEDVNIEKAIEGLIMSKFRNAGQTCISANRVFVHNKIHDEFVEKLKEKVNSLKVGDGLENSDIGPLISEKALVKVEKNTHEALKDGANLILGGKRHLKGKLFFEPTIITNINKKMRIFKEENFGPIIPIIKFSEDQEAIELANDTNYGLAAYFYTNSVKRVWKISENLQYGMFGINTGKISTYLNPFGGLKESGIGREGSSSGLEPFLEKKFVSWEI